jgi:metallo-beta-lactamase family protein
MLEASTGERVLIDCGLVQGDKVATDVNREAFAYDISKVNALFITHAHLDHVGRIPKFVKEGYRGPIYSTFETMELAEIVMRDAVKILDMEARSEGLIPLYEEVDVDEAMKLWKTIKYHEDFSFTENVSVYLKDAGHILGSSLITFTLKNKDGKDTKILFTGDLGNSPAPLLRDTEEVGDVDYIVMESVYGDRNHEMISQRENRLKHIVNDTLNRGGTLVIPAFAIDRTQIILYELNNMVEKGLIPSVPVFVDSPMATKATNIYAGSTHLFNEKVQEQIDNGDDIFAFPKLRFSVSPDESRSIDKIQGAKIILAGSGMSVGGRVIGHEEFVLPDPKNTLLLVGYQSPGSLGRKLANGDKKIDIYGRTIKVRAKVEQIYGYSAHRDSDHLMEFVSTSSSRLKKVFVVLGEPSSSMHLAQRINDEFEVTALVPELGISQIL